MKQVYLSFFKIVQTYNMIEKYWNTVDMGNVKYLICADIIVLGNYSSLSKININK